MSDFIHDVEKKLGDSVMTFAAHHGGSIDVVGGRAPHITSAATDILASLGSVGTNLMKHSSLGAAVAMAATLPLAHELGAAAALVTGTGAMAGLFNSFTKGSKGRVK